jgi:hypothetical protein
MLNPDTINAVFEGGGACLLCLNVRRLWRDKTLQGVSLFPTIWWNIWGFWNVYYYAALSQPASFWAGSHPNDRHRHKSGGSTSIGSPSNSGYALQRH